MVINQGNKILHSYKLNSPITTQFIVHMSPFYIIYKKVSKHALDLVCLPKTLGFKEVEKEVEAISARYKEVADKHGREKVFKEGDMVTVYLRKERFLIDTYYKLKLKKYDPYEI